MASGQFHSGTSVGAAIGVTAGYFSGYLIDPYYIPSLCLGLIIGSKFFGPDLDHQAKNISNWWVRRLFGTTFLWDMWVRPYRLAKKHRGRSHFPIISTLVRVLYFLFPFTIVLFKDSRTSNITLLYYSIFAQIVSLPLLLAVGGLVYLGYHEALYVFVGGLVVSDLIHILVDYIY